MQLLAPRIRPATASDLPAVVALIRELATFEKLPLPDDAAAARLHADFERKNCFELLVVEEEDADAALGLVGYALFFMTYSSFRARPSLYLEDLYVRPASRSRGLGAALMRTLAATAEERGCGRFEWVVLDWNVRAQAFYASLGAGLLPEWRICRIDLAGGA